MRTSRALASIALAAFALTACSGIDDTTAVDDAAEDAMEDMDEMADDAMENMDEMSEDAMDEMDDMAEDMGDMDMGDMDMGSSDGPRADEVESAELRQGDFVVLDSAPDAFTDASGTALLALDPGSWLTVDVEGLPAGTEVVGHLHAESCATSGGPHFKFDPDGGDTPPNEVHIAATAGDDGALTVSVSNEMVASDALSLVIHAKDGDTTKALCADLDA